MKPYSPATLADRWGCSAETVRQMCRRGDLRWFPVGGKLIRIPASEVERVECQNTASSGTGASGALPTDIPAVELRLARMIGDGQRLSLVNSGGGSTDRRRNG